jgi:TRAP-type C4-dicarboxylate transport system permease small subunit
MTNTTFNFSYFLSLLFTLITIYVIHMKFSERLPKILIYFIIPITVAYLTLFIFNNLFNHVDNTVDNIGDYLEDKYTNTLESTKYFNVFPVFIILFIVFSILLYLGLFN